MQEANLDKWSKFGRLFSFDLSWYTSTCALCRARDVVSSERALDLCLGCLEDLPWRTQPWNVKLSGIDSVWACFDFAYPIQQLIHRMKFGHDLATAKLLGELIGYGLATRPRHWLDKPLLCPVPLSRSRLLVRGFNQSLEISLPIAAQFNLAIDNVSAYKLKVGRSQSRLNAASRRANRRNAFSYRGALPSTNVVIVDDVITTGATVRAMAASLRRAGAQSVSVWALAAA